MKKLMSLKGLILASGDRAVGCKSKASVLQVLLRICVFSLIEYSLLL